MTGRERKRRDGLSGLPITDFEVVEFDLLRQIGPGGDFRALIACWSVVAITFALAIWGDSIGLGIISAIAALILLWWTVVKLRARMSAGRLTRQTLLEPEPSSHTGQSAAGVANAEGWFPDPTGRHEARWFSMGTPTPLVRDGAIEARDPIRVQPQPPEANEAG
jgi:hypothetical protein